MAKQATKGARNPDRQVRHFRMPDDVYRTLEKARGEMTRTAAVTEAIREWSQRRIAGTQADVVAPLLSELVNQRVAALEDRLVKLIVRIGYLATTNVELLLEQRRRNGVNMDALFRELGPRIDRRWRRPRDFDDMPVPSDDAVQRAKSGTE